MLEKPRTIEERRDRSEMMRGLTYT